MKAIGDTIVALITGRPPAAVATLRLSGPDAWPIASQVFRPWPEPVEPRRALFGQFVHGDDGIALPFAEGHSYTGEATVELSIHGSLRSVRDLLEACLRAGARHAEPGEFTLRAFLMGRIDLTQAEGVRATVEAATEAQLRAADHLRRGTLRVAIETARNELLRVLAAIEASVDFGEEVGPLDRESVRARVSMVLAGIERLLAQAPAERILRDGLRIALVGRPNAGKSSLFNALLRSDRAIVTAIPGTTRDTVEEWVDLAGVPCLLMDTAGLRPTDDPIESLGVERTRAAIATADARWYVFDGHLGWSAEDEAEWTRLPEPKVLIRNKADLEPNDARGLPMVAIRSEGLGALADWVRTTLGDVEAADGLGIQARHVPLLEAARDALVDLLATLDAPVPDDLIAVHTQRAIQALGEIVGIEVGPDLLDALFAEFCIGK
ncbi:MAG TPA: tRNA uridine-5-carboxymethylaminomethyl(34) synthesis GTPase MnmE [Fimbriimonadaceae bacterium]|nr:tRNA uridine-5-carboxymethylaminomethyl(34) synthesis GTPase MnmE [Fimbriimonadaceae bacterium]